MEFYDCPVCGAKTEFIDDLLHDATIVRCKAGHYFCMLNKDIIDYGYKNPMMFLMGCWRWSVLNPMEQTCENDIVKM